MSRDFEGPPQQVRSIRTEQRAPRGGRAWAAVLAAVMSGAVIMALLLTALPATNG